MMIQLREPRATLWPFPHPEATGDIIEAAMGICFPWQNVHLEYITTFAGAWGFPLSALTDHPTWEIRGCHQTHQHARHVRTPPQGCSRTRVPKNLGRHAEKQVPPGGPYEGAGGA
eukprot:6172131-Pyramimonas_sp.AAC.1